MDRPHVKPRIIHGNALDLPLEDETVDLVCTSPPYFGLRSYTDDGEHYAGQIGAEATPAEFVDALIAATREMVRVLKPSGSIFVNLGDKYATRSSGTDNREARAIDDRVPDTRPQTYGMSRTEWRAGALREKSLMLLPQRYAIRCVDELGLILRAEIIWSKPNGLPESVTDRVRRSHEQWFHFTKSPRYFSAVDEIREAHKYPTDTRHLRNAGTDYASTDSGFMNGGPNPLGKLPGSVWTIPTEPLRVPDHLGVDHFAAFPTEWPRRIIQGWSPREVCTACGEGRRPVSDAAPFVAKAFAAKQQNDDTGRAWHGGDPTKRSLGIPAADRVRTITGYACACPDTSAPTTPGKVLDPFGGTGTTALVADVLGRDAISVDMSADYCRLARWRTTDPRERARAARVEAPPAVIDGQLSLFDELA